MREEEGKWKISRSCLRRAAGLFACIALMVSLCACWNRRELNSLSIVMGTGIDLGDEPDTIRLTAQIVKISEIRPGSSGTSGGTSREKAYVNIQGINRSVLAVFRDFTRMTNRKLYFPHNKVLIFGREMAEQNISEGLDTFLRDNETRMNMYLLISRGSACEILCEEPELEKVPAVHLAEMIENQKYNSEIVRVTLRDYAMDTLSTSKSPVAPMAETYEMNGKKKVKLEGTAVFKGGKMIGELDKMQTRGLLWVTGEARATVITVETQWGQVVLELVQSNSTLKPVKMENGTIRMKLKIEEDGYIESNETSETMSSSDKVEMLERYGREVIVSEVESALEQAQSLSADVFGFGEAIRRDFPEEWDKLMGNWDEAFCEIGLDIDVDLNLHSTGGLVRPVVPGGAK